MGNATSPSARTARAVKRSEQAVALSTPPSERRDASEENGEPLLLVHHHPGYLRIRSTAFIQPEDDCSVVAAAHSAAEGVSGFRSWSLNPKTGSVVIEYDPGALDVDDLLRHIAKSAGLRAAELSAGPKRNREELVSAFLDTVQEVNEVVGQLTDGRADLRELVPMALAATSVVSFVLNDERGRLPQWSSALYRSYRIFMHWHRRDVRTRERTARKEQENSAPNKKRSTHP